MASGVALAESKRIDLGWDTPKGLAFPLKEDYYPGDLNYDPLGLKPTDPAELRIMQEKELSHGRLGMLAAAGFLAQEAVTGATWGAQDAVTENALLGGFFTQEAAELARDLAAGM